MFLALELAVPPCPCTDERCLVTVRSLFVHRVCRNSAIPVSLWPTSEPSFVNEGAPSCGYGIVRFSVDELTFGHDFPFQISRNFLLY